jgi:hypothetical protein
MLQFAIRCHPTVPVATDELEEWLELQLERLRADAPTATVRVSRLTQGLPSGALEIGWLLEFELPESERILAHEHLSVTLTDMVLLGFQPTVLAPVDMSAWRVSQGGGAVEAWAGVGGNGGRS